MTPADIGDTEPNDPTRSGPPLSFEKGAWLSHNEIEQLCLKAARGAGMSWGLAEEAGFAAAWLARHGLDGPMAVLAQISHAQGRVWQEICPAVAPDRFGATEGQVLCPITLGTALCDHAALLGLSVQEAVIRIGPVSHPLLLLPFLSDLARTCGAPMRLDWPGGAVVLGTDGGASGDVSALGQVLEVEGDLSIHVGPVADQKVSYHACLVTCETLSGLNSFALKTTVPSSEASRSGAGADDNE